MRLGVCAGSSDYSLLADLISSYISHDLIINVAPTTNGIMNHVAQSKPLSEHSSSFILYV